MGAPLKTQKQKYSGNHGLFMSLYPYMREAKREAPAVPSAFDGARRTGGRICAVNGRAWKKIEVCVDFS
jgi:hypothetical protein